MIHCPVCRGRVNAARSCCSRCEMNLYFLIQIEKKAEELCFLALQALSTNQWMYAQQHANHALSLMNTPFTQALYSFIVSKKRSKEESQSCYLEEINDE
jgi:hypothetical protein